MEKFTVTFILATAIPVSCINEPSLTENEAGFFAFDVNLKQHNPYPELCRETSNMSPKEIRAMNICIMKEKWNQEIAVPLEEGYARRASSKGVLMNFVSGRPESAPGDNEDCLFSQRNTMRPFQGVCRTKKFEKSYASETWLKLYNEIAGDFSYMWDYVLWDKNLPNKKENQLWYLILYIKTLASMISNPMEIVNIVRDTPGDEEFKAHIDRVERRMRTFSEVMIDAIERAIGKEKSKTVTEQLQLTVMKQLQRQQLTDAQQQAKLDEEGTLDV